MINKPQASPDTTLDPTDLDTVAEFNAIVGDGDFVTEGGWGNNRVIHSDGSGDMTSSAALVFDGTTLETQELEVQGTSTLANVTLAGELSVDGGGFTLDPTSNSLTTNFDIILQGLGGAGDYRMVISDDNGTLSHANLPLGWAVDVSTEVEASPNVLTEAESGKIFTNEGTAAMNFHTLPAATAGYTFTFVVQDAMGIRIVAGAGDTIQPGAVVASATGGFIQCSDPGSSITLAAINDTEWMAISIIGTWSVDT